MKLKGGVRPSNYLRQDFLLYARETLMLIDKLFDIRTFSHDRRMQRFNEEFDDVAIEAIRGDVENTGNMDLAMRVMVPTERNIPEPARYSFLHDGKGKMPDHVQPAGTENYSGLSVMEYSL